MSRPRSFVHENRGRFPRVSGDEPVVARLSLTGLVFSPRERG